MSKLIIVGVVVVIAIAGIVLFAGRQTNQVPSPTPTEAVREEPSPTEVMEGASVEIKNFAFGPKTLTVKKGTKVTFTNQDSVGHTATADDGDFGTEILAKGESESITFDKAGTFTYHCTPHPNMKGQIVVE